MHRSLPPRHRLPRLLRVTHAAESQGWKSSSGTPGGFELSSCPAKLSSGQPKPILHTKDMPGREVPPWVQARPRAGAWRGSRHQDGFGCVPAAPCIPPGSPGVPRGPPGPTRLPNICTALLQSSRLADARAHPVGDAPLSAPTRPSRGWWVPGGVLWHSPGGLGTLPGKASVSRYLPPSSGPSAKCGRRRRRRRRMCRVNPQSWAGMGLDWRALGLDAESWGWR